MNKKILINMFLYGLLIFGIIGSGALVLNEINNGPLCPTLLNIPACYVILGAFISLFVLHISGVYKYYFYGLAGIPISIALYGTFFQIFGGIECPKTDSGTPMCFISLALFSSILLLKILDSKK